MKKKMNKKNLSETSSQPLSDKKKKEVEAAVKKMIREYRQTLRLLGQNES